MRDILNIINGLTEGDVVPFGKKAAPDYTEDERYRGAGATQASGLTKDLHPDNPFHQHVASHIQDIFTTMAAGREISDDQKQKSKDILKISEYSNRITIHDAVQNILEAYNKGKSNKEKVTVNYKSSYMHYIYDDKKHLTNTVRTWDGKILFQSTNIINVYEYILEHFLPLVRDGLELPKVEKWLKSLASLTNPEMKSSFDGHDFDQDFDPDVNEYGGLTPYVQRLINRWDKQRSDRDYKGCVLFDIYHDEIKKMELIPRYGENVVFEFPDLKHLDTFIRRNEAKIQTWLDRQKIRREPAEAAIRKIVIRRMLHAIKLRSRGEELPRGFIDLDSLIRKITDERLKNYIDAWYWNVYSNRGITPETEHEFVENIRYFGENHA